MGLQQIVSGVGGVHCILTKSFAHSWDSQQIASYSSVFSSVCGQARNLQPWNERLCMSLGRHATCKREVDKGGPFVHPNLSAESALYVWPSYGFSLMSLMLDPTLETARRFLFIASV